VWRLKILHLYENHQHELVAELIKRVSENKKRAEASLEIFERDHPVEAEACKKKVQ